jgi:hypothetical protein
VRRIESYDFWPELLSLKDDQSLRELADRFNVTPGAISAAFKRTGTARLPAPPGPRALRHRLPTAEEPRPSTPSTVGDAVRPGSKDHLLAPHRHALGKLPDREIADQAGVSVRTVASYRSRYGIGGFTGGQRRYRREEGPAHAWHAVIRHDGQDLEGVVIAETLAAAAALIDGEGQLLSITWLGELLA